MQAELGGVTDLVRMQSFNGSKRVRHERLGPLSQRRASLNLSVRSSAEFTAVDTMPGSDVQGELLECELSAKTGWETFQALAKWLSTPGSWRGESIYPGCGECVGVRIKFGNWGYLISLIGIIDWQRNTYISRLVDGSSHDDNFLGPEKCLWVCRRS